MKRTKEMADEELNEAKHQMLLREYGALQKNFALLQKASDTYLKRAEDAEAALEKKPDVSLYQRTLKALRDVTDAHGFKGKSDQEAVEWLARHFADRATPEEDGHIPLCVERADGKDVHIHIHLA